MKCKSCKMRMSDFFITFDYENNGITKKAMNVPAYKCPSCNKVIVPDLILGKLEAFAEWEKSKVLVNKCVGTTYKGRYFSVHYCQKQAYQHKC